MVKKAETTSTRASVFSEKHFSWVFIILLTLSGLSMPAWSQFEEYALKAAFIEKFTHFVEWPDDSKKVFKLCVIGDNPFNGALQNLATLSRIKNKPAVFDNIENADSAQGCAMLFIDTSNQPFLRKILERLHNSPVLTISDTPGFAQQGVMINFIRKDSKIHFEINPEAAQAAGLKISSRLLKLATIISSSTRSGNKE